MEHSVISNTGDDGFAMWSNGDKLGGVTFYNNTVNFPRWDGHWPAQADCDDAARPDVANGTWGVNCECIPCIATRPLTARLRRQASRCMEGARGTG